MILVDSSVWADQFRSGDVRLTGLLEHQRVLMHPLVAGEIAMGSLSQRAAKLGWLDGLPQAEPASNEEVRRLVERAKLYSRGIGFIDAHLLASAILSDARLWTRDRRLHAAAEELGIAAD